MAVSLSISTTVNYQSYSGNYSNITVRVIASWTYGSFNRNSRSGRLTIDGTQYSFSSPFNSAGSNIGMQTLFTKTVNVYHNTDGSKSVSISASYITGVSSGTISASATKTLAKIPRGATITSAENFTDEGNPVIKYSNPAGSAATELQAAIYSTNGSTAYVAYRDITKTGNSYTFSLTTAERNALRNAIPNSKSMSVRFYVKTVIGGNTYTDYITKTFSITNALPSINTFTVEEANEQMLALTGDSDKLVKYMSGANVAFTASAAKGASIKSTKVICGNKSITTNGIISGVESGAFQLVVTDSRGFSVNRTVFKTLVNYLKPSCNMSNTKFDTDGVISFTLKGNYFNGSFGTTSNVLIVQYRYKTSGGSYGDWFTADATITNNTYTSNVTISGLDYRETYIVEARAIDEIIVSSSVSKTLSCVPVFDWSAKDFNFNVPVNNNHSDIGYYQISPNTNNKIGFGIGGSGVNRGIYDYQLNKWLFYYDDNVIRINDSSNAYTLGRNKVLWSGSYYMTEGQTANLSEAVSAQLTGIVLVFSRYDIANSEALNEHFSYHFVPKQMVALQEGKGSIFNMSTSNETFAASKYLYISDNSIAGHTNNNATGTGATGVTYDNSRFILRYVIGV